MTYLSAKTLTALAILALPLAGCVTDSPNRSVESVHQPVVSYAAYTFDVQASGDSLSAYEAGLSTTGSPRSGLAMAIRSRSSRMLAITAPAFARASPMSSPVTACWSQRIVPPPLAMRPRAASA